MSGSPKMLSVAHGRAASEPAAELAAAGGEPGAPSTAVGATDVRLWAALGGGFYVAALTWLLWPTLLELNHNWTHSFNYSHGYVILLLAVLLAVREWRRAPLEPITPSVFGTAALAACVVGLVAARATSTQLAAEIVAPMLVLAAFWAVAGGRNAARFFLPLAYLYFAVTFWDVLIEPLQHGTVRVVSAWVHAIGVPAFIQGNFIHIPSGTIEVAGGCSGVHFFIAAAALSVYYGLRYYESWPRRAVLAAAAIALALLTNWIRVFILVVVAHLSHMQNYLIRVNHYYFGWVLFGVVALAPLFWLARVLEGPIDPEEVKGRRALRQTPSAPAPRPRAGVLVPRNGFAVLAGVVVLAGVWLAHASAAASGAASAKASAALSAPALPGWRRAGNWNDAGRPVFKGTPAETAAWYQRGGDKVGIFIARYPVQRQGSELVYYANSPEGRNADVVRRAYRSVTLPDGGDLGLDELEVHAGVAGSGDSADAPARRLVWYAMRVAGRWTTSNIVAKAYEALGAVTGRKDAEALVLSAECGQSCEHARRILAGIAAQAANGLAATPTRSGQSEETQ